MADEYLDQDGLTTAFGIVKGETIKMVRVSEDKMNIFLPDTLFVSGVEGVMPYSFTQLKNEPYWSFQISSTGQSTTQKRSMMYVINYPFKFDKRYTITIKSKDGSNIINRNKFVFHDAFKLDSAYLLTDHYVSSDITLTNEVSWTFDYVKNDRWVEVPVAVYAFPTNLTAPTMEDFEFSVTEDEIV